MSTKVVCIINGGKKLRKHAVETIALMKASPRLEVSIIHTERQYHATKLASKLDANDYDIVIAVGGDGTCNEVLNGIITTPNKPMMGIIPNGTGNDFHRMLGVFNPQRFVQALERKTYQSIDVGCVDFEDSVRYFINIADVGFGAAVVELMDRQRKRGLKGKLSYSTAIVRSFFAYRKKLISIQGEDFEFKGKSLMIAFCNGHTLGHGLVIHPDAELSNGQLGITVIGDVSLLTYIRNLGNLKKGKRITHPEAHYFNGKKIKIAMSGEQLAVEGDGELFGTQPSNVFVVENAVQLITVDPIDPKKTLEY
ncbi:MAG: YegS/Rv2252/BmrU family lipid kinase [Crocinitomicaceae bacterium]|nr:YegS/Rv2252/BmrU family lipid kinase [Crocinitomicaceae bacterium]